MGCEAICSHNSNIKLCAHIRHIIPHSGKDSCLNIALCQEYGHQLSCLANLCPPRDDIEEMNSFMYQSAAHNAIPYLAQCFNVPLYRKEINRGSKVQSLRYSECNEDEVEDLFLLLVDILASHPDVKGVSCGAIVSNYQRYRVENVCSRLGLTPLTYLWNLPRQQVLNLAAERGINAVLVKVAGAGLEPYKHLGKSLLQLQNALQTLHRKYGLDLCGEGGEYETLVLDMKIFHHYKLNIDESEIVLDEEDSSVGNLKINKISLIPKISTGSSIEEVSPNKLLDDEVTAILSQFPCNALSLDSQQNHSSMIISDHKDAIYPSFSEVTLNTRQDGMIYSSLISSNMAIASDDGAIVPANIQLRDIFLSLENSLNQINSCLKDCTFIYLYLCDMNDFSIVNQEYCKWFGENPPSRSCISIALNGPIRVMVQVVALANSYKIISSEAESSSFRNVVHVQGISMWAPQCIGPYSQANIVFDCILNIAGQIPLNPGTMTLYSPIESHDYPNILKLITLCLRHVQRIAHVLQSRLRDGLSCIIYIARGHSLENYSSIRKYIQYIVHQDVDCDDNKSFNTNSSGDNESTTSSSNENEIEAEDVTDIPLLFVEIPRLPRDSPIELEFFGIRGHITYDSNSTTDFSIGDALHTLKGTNDQCLRENKCSNDANTVYGFSDDIESWPIWPGNVSKQLPVKSIHNDLFSINSSESVDNASIYRSWHQIRVLPTSLGAGFIYLSHRDTRISTAHVPAICHCLERNIKNLVQASKLSMRYLRSVRIYYLSAYLSSHDTMVISSCLSRILGVNEERLDIAIAMVPVVSIEDQALELPIVIAANLIAIDGFQLQTERWIQQCRS